MGRCLTAVLKINGTDAFVCWDSGSELDAISPDFVRAAGIKTMAKESPIKVQLATKGSMSTTSYEVDVNINLGNTTLDHPLKVLNLNRWDVILADTSADATTSASTTSQTPFTLAIPPSKPCPRMRKRLHRRRDAEPNQALPSQKSLPCQPRID